MHSGKKLPVSSKHFLSLLPLLVSGMVTGSAPQTTTVWSLTKKLCLLYG